MKQKIVPLLDEETIRARVRELAASISDDYRGKEVVLLGVLKGALVFMADIMRLLEIDHQCDFVRLSSYGDGADSSGRISFSSGPSGSVRDKHVLIVDCVADTGLTLEFLTNHLRQENPLDIRVCVLLNKQARRSTPLHLDYVGFDIPNRFVVGYGLDMAEKHRGLPYIAYLNEED